MEPGWDTAPNWECLFGHRKQGFVNIRGFLMAGEKQHEAPCGRN